MLYFEVRVEVFLAQGDPIWTTLCSWCCLGELSDILLIWTFRYHGHRLDEKRHSIFHCIHSVPKCGFLHWLTNYHDWLFTSDYAQWVLTHVLFFALFCFVAAHLLLLEWAMGRSLPDSGDLSGSSGLARPRAPTSSITLSPTSCSPPAQSWPSPGSLDVLGFLGIWPWRWY